MRLSFSEFIKCDKRGEIAKNNKYQVIIDVNNNQRRKKKNN